MRIVTSSFAFVTHSLVFAISAFVSAQQPEPLPAQIDSQAHFVVWADVDRVGFEEFLRWANQTELGPLVQGVRDPEMTAPAKRMLEALRAAGAKRVFLTGGASALIGDLSAMGLIIRCDQPERCAAAIETTPIMPSQFLKTIEGAVLLAMSPEGLESLGEVNGAPSAELLAALESTEDAVGMGAAFPATAISLFVQSAPKDGSPMSAAVDRLVDLKWARASGSPPDSKLKLEARFDGKETAAEFATQVNLFCESMFPGGEKADLLVADQDRIKLSERSAQPIAKMVAQARAAARKTQDMNGLRQLVLAMHNFHDATGALPPQALTDKAGKRLLSWRVLLLPYLEEQELYQQFHLDEAWDSPHNLALLEKMPALYRSAGEQQAGEVKPGYTRFVAPLTANSIMGKPGDRCRLQDIADGTSNTILLLQAAPGAAVPWTKPDDLVVDAANPLASLIGEGQNHLLAAFADGSIHSLSAKLDPETLKALLSQDGGEVIPPGKLND